MPRNPKDIQEEVERNKEQIASLKEELSLSRNNEQRQKLKIKSLEKKIHDLEKKNEILLKKLDEMKVKIEKLEKENEDQKARKYEEDSVFIIIQIGMAIQRNMCKYVLGKDFKESYYYKFKEINRYIEKFVRRADQESAKQRLNEVNDKISWDQDLVDSLKTLKQKRIGIAHPELSSEKIQQAAELLREKGELDDEVMDNIRKLKKQWEITEVLLRR